MLKFRHMKSHGNINADMATLQKFINAPTDHEIEDERGMGMTGVEVTKVDDNTITINSDSHRIKMAALSCHFIPVTDEEDETVSV